MSTIRENFEPFVKNWLSINRHRKLTALYNSETEKLLNKKSVAKSSDNEPENQQKNFFGMEYILAFSLYMQVSTSYDKKNSSISIDEYEHLKDILKVSDIFAKKNQSYPFYIKRAEFIKKVLMLIEAVDMDQKFHSILPKLHEPPLELDKSMENSLSFFIKHTPLTIEAVISTYSDSDCEVDDFDSIIDADSDLDDAYTLELYKKLGEYSGHSTNEQTEIIQGVSDYVEKLIHEKHPFPQIHPIYLMPFLIFVSTNLPQNEHLCRRSLPRHKAVLFAEQGLTDFSKSIDKFRKKHKRIYSSTPLERIRCDFLLHLILDKEVNGKDKPYVRVLSVRNNKAGKYEKELTQYLFGFYLPDDHGNGIDAFAAFLQTFLTLSIEDKDDILKKIFLFNPLINNGGIDSASVKFFSGKSFLMPINQTLNLIVYNHLTGFITFVNNFLISEKKLAKHDMFLYSKTQWLFWKGNLHLNKEQEECFNKLILHFTQDVELYELPFIDPLKGFLEWQEEKTKEIFKKWKALHVNWEP